MVEINERVGSNQYVDYTPLFKKIVLADGDIIINAGGSGSSKSFSLCQFFLFKRLLRYKNYKLLVLRKIRHSCRLTIYKSFIDILRMYGLYNELNHNKSDLIYYFPETNSYIMFSGLDDREKIKSSEWDDIWCEEASDFERDDELFLRTRKNRGQRNDDLRARIWLSFNPIDCWVFDALPEGKAGVTWIWSNYKDNPFANAETIRTLEGLKDEDEAFYKVYALGERARAGNIIYEPFIMDNRYPDGMDEIIYGIDFGYNSPCGVVEIGYKEKDRYLTELLYKTHLKSDELIEELKGLIKAEYRHRVMYGDAENPQAIQEIYDAGFNIKPCIKGKDSVRNRLSYCRRQRYHTLASNVNLNKERAGYRYKQDKNGNVLDEPVKFRDHLIDAMGYADSTHNSDDSTKAMKGIKDVLRDTMDMDDRESMSEGELI